MRKGHLRVRVCSTLVLIFLFLSAPAGALGNWGLEVGRADAGDVAGLVSDWLSFKRERSRLDRLGLASMTSIARQRQFLGVADEELPPQQVFEAVQERWLNHVMGPLQRIALNPAASCDEARFAVANMIGMRRQQQLLGLEESATVNNIYEATEGMASLRCRDEALDECVATGRFMQILELMAAGDRQMALLGKEGSFESWAEDALGQCAIYELHFVSKTKFSDGGGMPVEVETVRDGKIQIQFEVPPGGLKSVRASLGEVLKGGTAGGNNPFFVSIKCKAPQPAGVPPVNFICSPGADSLPTKIRINELNLAHREFYIAYVGDPDKVFFENWTETEVTKERFVGEDKYSFEFEGGEFNLEGLIKVESETVPIPMPNVGISFYLAHTKDQLASNRLKIENTKRGVYPNVFQFTYADQHTDEFGVLTTDSTEFELIHKPKPKPFRKLPEPIRKRPAQPAK